MTVDEAAVTASGLEHGPGDDSQPVRTPYNEIYKKLFRWPEMVGGFLRGFIRRKLVRYMDFSTLVHLSSDFVNGNFRERESDTIWQAESRWEGKSCTAVILIEFQSSNDFRMARRILSYTALLLEDFEICRGIQEGGRWPVPLTIVLYNGWAAWKQTNSTMRSFFQEAPDDARETMPAQGYILVDVQRLPEEDLSDTGNPVVLWFLLERAKGEKDVSFALDRLEEMFGDGKRIGLYEDIVECAWRLVDPLMEAGRKSRPVRNLQEVKKMFSERFAAVREESRNEGIRQGETSSARTALLDMLEMRFGKVPEAVAADVNALGDAGTLRSLFRQAYSAPSIDEFIRLLGSRN